MIQRPSLNMKNQKRSKLSLVIFASALLFAAVALQIVPILRADQSSSASIVQISVQGQVYRPGKVTWHDGITVYEAIQEAGGFADSAARSSVKVTRITGHDALRFVIDCSAGGKSKGSGGLDSAFPLEANDLVYVP